MPTIQLNLIKEKRNGNREATRSTMEPFPTMAGTGLIALMPMRMGLKQKASVDLTGVQSANDFMDCALDSTGNRARERAMLF